MKELTKGYPAKVIMLFALPVMCGFIFQQLYNMADSKIVSTYVGTNAFAAVGATAVVVNIMMGFMNGLTQGFAIPIANCFGAKNMEQMRRFISGAVVLTLLTAVIFTVSGLIFIEDILVLLKTPEEIMTDAVSYVKIIIAGLIFTALYNLAANTLRAVGDSKTPLYCLIIAVIVNIGLDLLFVKVFSMGIKGAAYATIISQALSGFMCLGYIVLRFREIIPHKNELRLAEGQLSELLSAGAAMGLMSCIVNIGTVVLQSAINSLGTNIVAAHTAARRVFDILTVILYTVGVAMTTYASQNMGAGKPERVKQGLLHAIIIVTIETTVLLIICFVFGRPVLQWITNSDNPAIIEPAVMYTRVSIVFFYTLGPLLVLRCTLQGIGSKVLPVVSSGLEMLVKILSASFLVPIFKYKGVAFTEPISWILMTILLMAAYIRFWKKYKNVAEETKETKEIAE